MGVGKSLCVVPSSYPNMVSNKYKCDIANYDCCDYELQENNKMIKHMIRKTEEGTNINTKTDKPYLNSRIVYLINCEGLMLFRSAEVGPRTRDYKLEYNELNKYVPRKVFYLPKFSQAFTGTCYIWAESPNTIHTINVNTQIWSDNPFIMKRIKNKEDFINLAVDYKLELPFK